MNDTITTLFGDLFHEDTNLDILQISCRSVVLFFITIIIIKVSGARSFAKKTTFDTIIAIMLGAILSRAVVGANPFFPIVASGFVLGIIHRVIAWLCVKNDHIGKFFKGTPKCLYEMGKENNINMLKEGISHKDLMEEIHVQLNKDSLENINKIILERSGKISIIEK